MAPRQIPDAVYIAVLTDTINLGKEAMQLFHDLFCGEPRELTMEVGQITSPLHSQT
jgi:hypothetical protein